jgi:hypothetical protein
MNTLINFGKYKGQTYDYVIKNDIKYCNYIITQESSYQPMIKFKNFIQNNIEEQFKKNYDINKLKNKNGIKCSDLSEYMKYDENIINLIKDCKITINKISNKQTIEDFSLPNDIFGIFIDYLIRYEICKKKMIEFNDNRANSIHCNNIIKEFIFEYIYNSYNNMKQNKATMQDILNVSICHSCYFCNFNALEYINYNNIISNKQYNNINKWIDMKILNKNIILCNPTLGDAKLNISADADLILDNELIDIKTSKYNKIGNNIIDFIQLFVYASLYYNKTKKYINKLTIFNSLYLIEHSIDINNDVIHKILNILTNYNIGGNIIKDIKILNIEIKEIHENKVQEPIQNKCIMDEIYYYKMRLNNYSQYIVSNNMKIKKNKNNKILIDKLNKDNKLYENKINEINNILKIQEINKT